METQKTLGIEEAVEAFFEGEHFSLFGRFSRPLGHLWVSKHEEGFETLVWEPLHGGQKEIAVRFKKKEEKYPESDHYAGKLYVGYQVSDLETGYLHSVNCEK